MAKSPAQSKAQTHQIDDSNLENRLPKMLDLTRLFGRTRIRNSVTQSNRVKFGLGPKPTRGQPYCYYLFHQDLFFIRGLNKLVFTCRGFTWVQSRINAQMLQRCVPFRSSSRIIDFMVELLVWYSCWYLHLSPSLPRVSSSLSKSIHISPLITIINKNKIVSSFSM